MRVMLLTRKVDRADARVGFAHGWIEALAARVEQVDVVCQERGEVDLPPNVTVTSAGKEHGAGRVSQFIAFQRAIWPRMPGTDVVFGHMIPRYTLVAAPAALLNGVPMVQWYTHSHVDAELRLAHALVKRVVTASPESYRLPGDKVRVVGHGIDFDQFKPGRQTNDERRVLSVGRLSPVKDIQTLVQAAALLVAETGFEDVRFVVAGDAPAESRQYKNRLEALIVDNNLQDRFQLAGAIPHSEVVRLYQSGNVMVSLSRTGSLDKAVLEAMGCGLPVLVTGEVYLPLLGGEASRLKANQGAAQDVAQKLTALLSLPAHERHALGMSLRENAAQAHSLDGLMDRLVTLFGELVA